jgi:hypothetical protein
MIKRADHAYPRHLSSQMPQTVNVSGLLRQVAAITSTGVKNNWEALTLGGGVNLYALAVKSRHAPSPAGGTASSHMLSY